MSRRSRLSRIVRAKSMKEILTLCDGFVNGPTPQVRSILIFCLRMLFSGKHYIEKKLVKFEEHITAV